MESLFGFGCAPVWQGHVALASAELWRHVLGFGWLPVLASFRVHCADLTHQTSRSIVVTASTGRQKCYSCVVLQHRLYSVWQADRLLLHSDGLLLLLLLLCPAGADHPAGQWALFKLWCAAGGRGLLQHSCPCLSSMQGLDGLSRHCL